MGSSSAKTMSRIVKGAIKGGMIGTHHGMNAGKVDVRVFGHAAAVANLAAVASAPKRNLVEEARQYADKVLDVIRLAERQWDPVKCGTASMKGSLAAALHGAWISPFAPEMSRSDAQALMALSSVSRRDIVSKLAVLVPSPMDRLLTGEYDAVRTWIQTQSRALRTPGRHQLTALENLAKIHNLFAMLDVYQRPIQDADVL